MLDGVTVEQYLTQGGGNRPNKDSEERTLGTAAQLMEVTLFWQLQAVQGLHSLHMLVATCGFVSCRPCASFTIGPTWPISMLRLQISCLRTTNTAKCNSLRPMDFGLSQTFDSGKGKAPPLGATLEAASPEVLFVLRRSEQFDLDILEVAAAADLWSVGICLYVMLTGEAPFLIDGNQQHEINWHRYREAIKVQYSWVRAVQTAENNGLPVKHRLLDTVRACSTTPDAAADFFSAILHPNSTKRLTGQQALDHLYLRRCVSQMQDFQHAQAYVLSQNPCCISTDSHSLACAPLPLAIPAQHCPAVFPSSAACAQCCQNFPQSRPEANLTPCLITFPTTCIPLLMLSCQLSQAASRLSCMPSTSTAWTKSIRPHSDPDPTANFPSMDAPSVEPGTAKAEASLQHQGRDAGICTHYVEILPEDEEESWAAEAEASIQSPGAVVDICGHRIEILPEDEEEIWVAEAEPSVQRPLLQAPSVQCSDPPHMKGQKAMSPNTSLHPAVRNIEAPRPSFASVNTPAQQAKSPTQPLT